MLWKSTAAISSRLVAQIGSVTWSLTLFWSSMQTTLDAPDADGHTGRVLPVLVCIGYSRVLVKPPEACWIFHYHAAQSLEFWRDVKVLWSLSIVHVCVLVICRLTTTVQIASVKTYRLVNSLWTAAFLRSICIIFVLIKLKSSLCCCKNTCFDVPLHEWPGTSVPCQPCHSSIWSLL